jgi:hypothetical protein
MYPSSNPVKVWQLQVRPTDSNVDQHWLSVFDLASSSAGVADTEDVEVTSGNILGVTLAASDGNTVVIASTTTQDSAISSSFAYSVPQAFARHVVMGVAPGSTWTVAADPGGGDLAVSVTPGGSLHASNAGVLEFVINEQGTVRSGDTLFFDGFDH